MLRHVRRWSVSALLVFAACDPELVPPANGEPGLPINPLGGSGGSSGVGGGTASSGGGTASSGGGTASSGGGTASSGGGTASSGGGGGSKDAGAVAQDAGTGGGTARDAGTTKVDAGSGGGVGGADAGAGGGSSGRWSPAVLTATYGTKANPTFIDPEKTALAMGLTAAEYVKAETLSTWAAATQTSPWDLKAILGAVTSGPLGPRVVLLPPGNYTWTDFAMVNQAGIQIGKSGFESVRGIIGSGYGTELRQRVDSSTKMTTTYPDPYGRNNAWFNGNAASVTNQTCLIRVQGGITGTWANLGYVMANFSLVGTHQGGTTPAGAAAGVTLTSNDSPLLTGHFYHGLIFYNCQGCRVRGLYLRGASPGFHNAPPGETFGISFTQSPNGVLEDSEIDGRDEAGNLICSSGSGWNSTVNATIRRTYFHHGWAGHPAFWQVQNITTEDLWSYKTSSGTGRKSGFAAVNMERCWGTIRHIRPNLRVGGIYSAAPGVYTDPSPTPSNIGAHLSMCNDQRDMPDVQVIDPIWDDGPHGQFTVTYGGSGYNNSPLITSLPRIFYSGAPGGEMTARRRSLGGFGGLNPLPPFSFDQEKVACIVDN